MEEIKLFCAATIANISCGFDVLGLALDNVGDEMIVRKVPQKGMLQRLIDFCKRPGALPMIKLVDTLNHVSQARS